MVRIITAIVFIIGIGLFSYSLTLPYYKDEKAGSNLLSNSYSTDKQEYYKREATLRTSKTRFMDLGAGVAIASGIILLYFLFTKTKTLADFKKLKTLDKVMTFACANFVWILLIPGIFWYYSFRGERGDYAPFADSIAIPIYTQVPVYFFLLVPLNIFMLLTTVKTNLPTHLFVKADTYSWSVIWWEVFFGFWLFINLLCSVSIIVDGDHVAIVVNLVFTFILLTLRAGQISKYKQVEDVGSQLVQCE